jgi:uncharacterized protein YecE (DUF72 family)
LTPGAPTFQGAPVAQHIPFARGATDVLLEYSDAQLLDFASRVNSAGANDVWCIFDNTARYAAWDDACRFIDLIRGCKVA